MNERKLQHGSRINTADEATLEGSVGPNIFESPDDGLVRKAGTRSLAPRAALTPWVDTGRVHCKDSRPEGSEACNFIFGIPFEDEQ